MKKIIAYATADLHLPEEYGQGPWAGTTQLSDDIWGSLRHLVSLCVRDSADLWIAGDNFDGPDVQPSSLRELHDTLSPVRDAKGIIRHVLGNHDRGKDWLSCVGSSHVGQTAVRGRNGIIVCGLSNTTPDEFRRCFAKISQWNYLDVLLCHQSIREWTGGGCGLGLADMPGSALIVCGDTHVRTVSRNPNSRGLVVSPGPLIPQSIAEFEQAQHCWAVYDDMTVQSVPIVRRIFLRIDVSTHDEADAALGKLHSLGLTVQPEEPRVPYVVIKSEIPIAGFEEAAKKVAEDANIHLRVMMPGKARIKHVTGRTTAAPTGISDVIRAWPGATDPAKELAVKITAPGADFNKVLKDDAEAQISGSF